MVSNRLPEEKFIYAALAITLTAGSTLGAWFLANAVAKGIYGQAMGRVIHIHAHAQLFGWVTLFIMGMAYVILPRFKATPIYSRRLENASFWLMFTGIILWIVVQTFQIGLWPLFYAAPILETMGAGAFAYNIIRTLNTGRQKDFWDKWIKTGLFWLSGLSAFGIVMSWLSVNGQLNDELLHTYYLLFIYGFILNFILGVGLRTLPAFLGSKAARPKVVNIIFWFYNLALLGLAATLATGGEAPESIMKLLELLPLIALSAFIITSNVWRRPETSLAEEFALDTSYMSYLPTAYFWLAVGIILSGSEIIFGQIFSNPEIIEGAATHAITIGFISMMIFGYATKAVPIFKGRRLYSPGLNNLTFFILNLGLLLRVVSQVIFGFGIKLLLPTLSVSGLIELGAFALFAYNIARTTLGADNTEDEIEDFAAVSGHSIVADVLERRPETLEVFLKFGFTPLTNPVSRRTIAKTITVGGAARMRNVDLGELLKSLNACQNHQGAEKEVEQK